jgi:hypothetical protein
MVCGNHLLALVHALQQLPQAVGVVRAHDQVELGDAAQQRGALLRRHAPGHDQRQPAHVLALALDLRGGGCL